MNASTDIRLMIMKGQKHFPLALVSRLLAERDALVTDVMASKTARVEFIGGHVVVTEDGETLYCEPVPVVIVEKG